MSRTKVVLASNNGGKVKEFQALLQNCGFDIVPQAHFNLASVEETGLTFVENAIIKARHACEGSNLPAIADDSGLEVDSLQGQPGIYSARFAGRDATDEANNQLLLAKLQGLPLSQRRGRYQCVLVFMRHALDPTPIICQAAWEGVIAEAPAGEGGFGYDPIFYLPEFDCTSAQITAEVKNTISHRGRAMAQLLQQLQSHF